MEFALKYRKTEKGKLVSPTKTFGLPWPMRFALMHVNERRTAADLHSTLGERFQDSVQTLLESGFIESVPDEAAAKTVDLKAAVRWLTDRLGPQSEQASLKIERAKTRVELAAALQSASKLVQAQLGQTQAERFAREFIDPQ